MEYKPVLNKRDFGVRYRAGEFGNASPSWDSLDKFLAQPRTGLYHLRNDREAGGATYYSLTSEQIADLWMSASHPEHWYCSEQVPVEILRTLLIQGEVMQRQYEAGLYLLYSTVPKPMREALREKSGEKEGIIASETLRFFMDANSWEWLNELLRRYPYHVVEFSTFEKKWGTLYPMFNSVFWEVRLY